LRSKRWTPQLRWRAPRGIAHSWGGLGGIGFGRFFSRLLVISQPKP
jgi:hypothetical protein